MSDKDKDKNNDKPKPQKPNTDKPSDEIRVELNNKTPDKKT